jgi:hypothetical protein
MSADALKTLIEDTAQRLLSDEPDPVVRFRLLRDVLSSRGREFQEARAALERSCWVQLLAREQRPDGGWGRFHSKDCAAKQFIGTTEGGVGRSLEVGLDKEHPILRNAADYICRLLRGECAFPDRAEKNDRWRVGWVLFAASTLARIDPAHPMVDDPWRQWREVLQRSFPQGQFSDRALVEAHQRVNGLRDKVGYLNLRTRYASCLLGARAAELPVRLGKAYARWLWEQPHGLGYVDVPMTSLPRIGRYMPGWLRSMHILARFPNWRKLAGDTIKALVEKHNADGLWDFGPAAKELRFSERWRKNRRAHDHSLGVLLLLRQYAQI